MKFKKFIPDFCIIIISITLLTIYPDKVVGLHYDEALTILKSWMIDRGLRPLSGMAPYVGALYHYLMWPLFEIFGYKIEVMRLTSAVFNTLSVILAMILFKHFHPSGGMYRYAGLLLCTFPAFVMLSRFAAEIQALNLFLSLTGFLFMAKSVRVYYSGSLFFGIFFAFTGGFFIGLLTYNHIIGLTIPAALLLSSSIAYRFNPAKKPVIWMMGVGFSGGMGIRIYQLLFTDDIALWSEKASEGSFRAMISDIPNIPALLNNALNGVIFYQRHVGQITYNVIPYITIATLLIAAARIWSLRKNKLTDNEKMTILFPLFLIVFIMLIAANFAPHYFLIPLYLYPLLLVSLAVPLINNKNGFVRKTGHFILTSVIVLNLFYLTTNYFHTFIRTGGSLSVYNVGSRLSETSNSWVRFDRLYNELTAKGVNVIIGDLSIITPLKVYDLQSGRFKIHVYSQINNLRESTKEKSALIFYNGVNLIRGEPVTPSEDTIIRIGSMAYKRDPSYDDHFRVFIKAP